MEKAMMEILLRDFGSVAKSIPNMAVRRMIDLISSASENENDAESIIFINASVSHALQLVMLLDEWRNMKLPYEGEGGSFGFVNGAVIISENGFDPDRDAHWINVRWNEKFLEYVDGCTVESSTPIPMHDAIGIPPKNICNN